MTTFSVIPGPEAAWPLEEPGIQRIPDRLAAEAFRWIPHLATARMRRAVRDAGLMMA